MKAWIRLFVVLSLLFTAQDALAMERKPSNSNDGEKPSKKRRRIYMGSLNGFQPKALQEQLEKLTENHMKVVVEAYKDKNDLKMVLGAGNQERDYTKRFTDYNFLVACLEESLEFLVSDANELRDGEPVLIPLDFNKESFFDLLERLKGRFKEIIFDWSVTKSVHWKRHHLEKIFEALQEDGVLYMDLYKYDMSGFSRVPIPNKLYDDYKNWSQNDWEKFISDNNKDFRLQQIMVLGTQGLSKIPSDEFCQTYAIKYLEKVGFKTKYEEESPYPVDAPWNHRPEDSNAVNTNFEKYDYILARKPTEEKGQRFTPSPIHSLPLDMLFIILKNALDQATTREGYVWYMQQYSNRYVQQYSKLQQVCKFWNNVVQNQIPDANLADLNPFNTPYVQELIKHKDERHYYSKRTPLHEAARKGNVVDAMILIKGGAGLEARDKWGYTPLHMDSSHDRTKMAKLLIESGANVNARNKFGRTPLHWAVMNDKIEIVKFLIENGTNLDLQDQEGKTPLDRALNIEMTNLLQEAMEKKSS